MITGYLNLVLDRADRLPWFYPAFAGLVLGIGIGWGILHDSAWGWPFLAAGLILMAIRPAGTSLRRYLLIRQCRRELDDIREHIRMKP